MKSKFSKSWKRSVQPRKQVKFRANAPHHIKRKLLSSTLDKPLRKTYGRRSIEVRKGDEVKIMRGKFKDKTGKIGKIDLKNTRIQVEGVQRMKGSEKLETWFSPSKVKIITLEDSDNKRLKSSKQKPGTENKETKEKK